MKEDYKFKLLGIDPAVPGGDRSVPPARQEGETPRIPTPRTDEAWAAWPYAGSGVSVHFARTLERELSAKQAEVDQMAREHGHEFAKHREEISALQRELESLKDAQGWRTISEAPLNKRVMVWFPYWGHEPFVAVKNVNGWFSEQILSDSGKEPIGWMPLPTPPVERSENKG